MSSHTKSVTRKFLLLLCSVIMLSPIAWVATAQNGGSGGQNSDVDGDGVHNYYYRVNDLPLLHRLLTVIQPSLLDRLVDQFLDTWSD